jgi:hypothetical protein
MKRIAIVVLLFSSSPVQAIQIFDGGNPGYHPTGGYTAGVNLTTSRVQASDFELASPAMLTDVRFWTLEPGNEFDGGIDWYLFEDVSGKPPANDFTGFAHGNGMLRSRERNQFSQGVTYDFALDTPVVLEANKRYWLGLELNDSTFAAGIYWVPPVGWLDPPRFSSYFGEPGATSHSAFTPGGWAHQYHDFAFKLFDNSVPEPATWVLVMGAILLLAVRHR